MNRGNREEVSAVLAEDDADSEEDIVVLSLFENLRDRAHTLRRTGYGFIGALILTVLGAGVLYYYIPLLAQFEAEQRTDALARLQEQIAAQEDKLRSLNAERDGLRNEVAKAIYLAGSRAKPQLLLNHLTAVQFLDAQTGWAVGFGGSILVTRDGGATWAPQTSGTVNALWDVQFFDAQTGWTVGDRGTILVTRDGGASWELQSSRTERTLRAVQFLDAQTGWAVGNSGTILVTRDGGATWAPQTSRTRNALWAVQFLNAQTGWVVGTAGFILVTRDGGATWAPQTSRTERTLRTVQFLDTQTGWAMGNSGTILVTRDGGATWEPQTSGTERTLMAVQFLDAQTGWAVGTSGTILVTGDGGTTWTLQTSGTEFALLAVQFLDAQTGWAVGLAGQMIKIEAPDISAIMTIESDAALRQTLEQIGNQTQIDSAPFLELLEEIENKRTLIISIISALRNQISGSEGDEDSILGQKFNLTVNITRVGLVALILLLVGVFTALYRYNLRLAAFYDSRADALSMLWSQDHEHTLAELADIFGPESIEFAKARVPTEHAFDLAREAIKSSARK